MSDLSVQVPEAVAPEAVETVDAKQSFAAGLAQFLPNIWHSIFRHPLPDSDLGASQTSVTNFFLHIHPVKVHKNTLRPLYTLGETRFGLG